MTGGFIEYRERYPILASAASCPQVIGYNPFTRRIYL